MKISLDVSGHVGQTVEAILDPKYASGLIHFSRQLPTGVVNFYNRRFKKRAR